MTILGIDPGSIVLGYGAIQSEDKSSKLIEYGVIRPKLKQEDFNLRLVEIYDDLSRVVERVEPEVVSIEKMFFHKNAQTLIKLAQARAIAVLVAAKNQISIVEYSPREVKKSITGRGNASKQQVQYFVRNLLHITETPEFFDATDALAIALTHHLKGEPQPSVANASKKIKNWSDFIQQNPDRLLKH